MKQSNTPSCTILSLFALAAFVCSPMVSSQPGVPPIEMTLEQFNQGRPANFYYLADSSEGYEAVCEEVLEALNEPYSRNSALGEFQERYSKYLLRSRLSPTWVEVPDVGNRIRRHMYDARHTVVDIDNNGEEEDVFVTVNTLSGLPVHNFVVAQKGVLPVYIDEISPSIWATVVDSGAFSAGQDLTKKLGAPLLNVYQDYNLLNPSRTGVHNRFLDLVVVDEITYILFTTTATFPTVRDAFVVHLSPTGELTPSCRLTSRYIVTNPN